MATMSDERGITPDDETTSQIWARHVFVCTSGKYCPEVDGDGRGVHARLKERVAAEGLNTTVRVNHSGCLDQCGHGPMIVVYPESVWYCGCAIATAPARTSFPATKRTAPLAGPSASPAGRSAGDTAVIAHRLVVGASSAAPSGWRKRI
jgi:hypothetical protein